jgi:glutamate--cysteine ligase
MAVRTVPVLDLDDVRAQLEERALTPGEIGRVGLELEWHVLSADDPRRSPAWSTITAAVDSLGPLPAGSRVTLEPGGQVELSSPPATGVAAAVQGLRADATVLHAALAQHGLLAAAVGGDPVRPPVHRHDGPRYAAMARAFAACGDAGAAAVMMCSTAALQLNLDAGPREAWDVRVTNAHTVGPVFTAISACSPWLHGRPTGWKSARMRAWQSLDPARTAPHAGEGEPSAAWASYALATPVLALSRPGGCDPVVLERRVPMIDWIVGRSLLGGRYPTQDDLDLHLTMLWPPLRLRGFLEIRSLDAVPDRWMPGLAALVTAMLDSPAADDVAAVCRPIAHRWQTAARDGLGDPDLHAAAVAAVTAALPHVPAALRADADAYAELIDGGRSPGDLLAADIERRGPAAAFAAAAA